MNAAPSLCYFKASKLGVGACNGIMKTLLIIKNKLV